MNDKEKLLHLELLKLAASARQIVDEMNILAARASAAAAALKELLEHTDQE